MLSLNSPCIATWRLGTTFGRTGPCRGGPPPRSGGVSARGGSRTVTGWRWPGRGPTLARSHSWADGAGAGSAAVRDGAAACLPYAKLDRPTTVELDNAGVAGCHRGIWPVSTAPFRPPTVARNGPTTSRGAARQLCPPWVRSSPLRRRAAPPRYTCRCNAT